MKKTIISALILSIPLTTNAGLLDVRISNLRPDTSGWGGTSWDVYVGGLQGWDWWSRPVNCNVSGAALSVYLFFKVNGRYASPNQAGYGGAKLGTLPSGKPVTCGATNGNTYYVDYQPLSNQGAHDVEPGDVKTVEACVGIQSYGTVLDMDCSNISNPIVVPPPAGATCNISAGSNLTVSFGQIERNDLTSSASSAYKVSKQFTITCTGTETEDFSVKLSGASDTQWNNGALATDNNNVGYVFKMNDKIMNNGTNQQISVRGTKSVPLDFYAVKNPNINNSNISTGTFKSSATLIVTQQ